ncbi:MAG: IPExxxVDY family protein [Bacteroidales bacterium]|nr:IPExxxVDY family protein [Bacteroidales bacterium]
MISKKNILQSEPFDDIMIIGVSSSDTDFVMAWHLNNLLRLNLTKKQNLKFTDQKLSEELSFYYYNQGENGSTFNLVMLNKMVIGVTKLPQSTDFLLIIRNNLTNLPIEQFKRTIRTIPKVILSYMIEWEKFKGLDTLLEQVDLHELSIERNKKRLPLRVPR